MGSTNSRLTSRSPESAHNRTSRRLLTTLLCGGSASSASLQTEDHLDELSTGSLVNAVLCRNESVSFRRQSFSTSTSGAGLLSSSTDESDTSRGGSNSDPAGNDDSTKYSLSRISVTDQSNSHLENINDDLMESRAFGAASEEQPSVASVSSGMTVLSPVYQDPETIDSDADSIRHASIDSRPAESGSLGTAQSLLGILLPDGEQDSRNASLLFVDMVNIGSNNLSSSTAEISNREARRNTRRMFWNAFSRSSFRRTNDSPTIVFRTRHADDLGSHDRWLLDFGGDLHYDGGLESRYAGIRSHHRSERQWQSRYEMSERFHNVHDVQNWQTSLCAMGLHPHGTCSCESLVMPEDSSSQASFSQIIMLADALFEVLEEIHRHRMSLSASTLSLPAPEAVVNSFPLKDHKKLQGTESWLQDVQQCHICLLDYEEGDKIRVLPCTHEYHMLCVDKWLKEIHGVCPLCRDDVCKGGVEVAT